jgi:hypothetical protein
MNTLFVEETRLRFLELNKARESSRAGAALGRMRQGYRRNRGRSKPKRWTGFLANNIRAWFGRKVLLPNGTVGIVCGIVRGNAAIRWDDPFALDGVRFGLFRVCELRLFRYPAAVQLGALKKGKTERSSHRKTIAARLNGLRPPRPGSRQRGRPRKRPLSETSHATC